MANTCWSIRGAACLVAMALLGVPQAPAQSVAGVDPYTNQRVERVTIRIANPSADAGLNARVDFNVRTQLALFPGVRFSQQRIDLQLAQARRIRDVGDVDYDVSFGRQGGLNVVVTVTLAEDGAEGRGLAFGGDFPVIYEKDGTFLRFKLDLLALTYGNANAWFGRPDAMLAGNPLVEGEPSGAGWEQWVESYAHYGIYGITPIGERLYFYGGLSGLASYSVGQELFTDETRGWNALEDAYVGLVGGRTDADGNRVSYNLSVGRQRFTLANGFLIANTAANG